MKRWKDINSLIIIIFFLNTNNNDRHHKLIRQNKVFATDKNISVSHVLNIQIDFESYGDTIYQETLCLLGKVCVYITYAANCLLNRISANISLVIAGWTKLWNTCVGARWVTLSTNQCRKSWLWVFYIIILKRRANSYKFEQSFDI